MKRAFIRALWGEYDNSTKYKSRRFKIDKDIKYYKTIDDKTNLDFHAYVFGKENYDRLKDFGIKNVVLVDNKPFLYDTQTETFGNKLFLINKAMEDFDEVVYLDWDCVLTKQLPDNFWDVLNEKREIQACLQQCRRQKVFFRKPDNRKVSNGGFMYFRQKRVCMRVLNTWQNTKHRGFNDEIAVSKVIDSLIGRWEGIDAYWDNFEPMVCDLKKGSCFTPERLATKDICFKHYL